MRFLPCFFLLTVALPSWAGGLDDPFGTEAMAPLKVSPSLAARVGEAPCATALPATALTALEAVDLALCNHPQTREVWASARVQAALVGVARAGWLPNLDASASATRFQYDDGSYNRRSAALTLSWLLIDFGQRSANVENAQQLLNAAAATQDATVQSLFLAALQTYYTAQATQAAVISASEAERSAREAYQAADARYNVGVATPADRLQAQTALSQATLNRIRAEGEARNGLGALANALGFEAQQKIVLAELPALPAELAFQKEVDAMIAEAQARRPDLKAAEAQLKAAEASVDLARAQGRPTVSLAAGPSWQNSAGVVTQGGSIGLTLNVPIFTGFDTTYRVRSAAAQADVRAAQRDRIKNQIALDVWRAYQSLTTATQSLKTSADLVASAEQSERVALGRYKAGVGTVLDLLSAQSALASARLQRIQAQLDWNVYRATLAQSMGALDYTLLQPAAEGRP
ncbi:TolC family protein [Ferribacterium limneticum]|jgi:TolC family type I secretion outer membrane protein|uniref:TolC family protein n=1 Tax=Ferribacterium limneticum TaxID=76259 RepID=UPI001CFBAB58|nr:TolC family protein [Ferribacterium limneticum]UCV18348.1 TolC family protein [Ferribacterium limneticum]